MDLKILPLFLWICLLFILISGQRIPQPQPLPSAKLNPNSPFPASGPPQPKMQPLPPPPMMGKSPMNAQPNQNLHPLQQQSQNASSNNMQRVTKRKNDELSNVKDETIKRVLLELSSPSSAQTPEVQARVAQLLGPLFYTNFEQRKDRIVIQGRNASLFPQRLLSAFMEIRSTEVKGLVLQKRLDTLHASDIGLLPMAFLYAIQNSQLRNITGFNLAGVVKVNRGDTTIAFKAADALSNRTEEQIEFLQSLGTKILPDAQRMLIQEVLEWWGPPSEWKDRQLSLLTAAGDPLLSFIPPNHLETLDEEQADKVVNVLGQSSEMGKVWWMKPTSVKKAWFELAKRARFFGAVQEWSFMRMQKLSFLLEGASPEDLEHVPPVPEIKGLVIGNHYSDLQARVVFDAFYKKTPLSQEDLQEFQFHILDLVPSQLQRFDLADSFSTLDDMMVILENQQNPSYPSLLQITYYMWPLVNRTTGLVMAPPKTWQKKELSQIGKLLFLLPKSVFLDLPSEVISWDSNTLHAIRSKHFSQFQIWFITSKILSSVEERFKSDYAYMIPPPFQKGIPTENLTQILLTSTLVRPDTIRVLIEESEGMLTSQKAVIAQRIRNRLQESTIMRHIISSSKPAELFELFSPRHIMKIMPNIIKTIMGMPEFGRFGTTAIQAKLFPRPVLSLWMRWVREQAQLTKWTAEDILGRSAVGSAHAVQLTIMGLNCREVQLIDPLDILPVILHYRHEFYALRKFNPQLSFELSLRSCFLDKVVSYLRIKRSLNGNENNTHSNILSELSPGEIIGIGGEVFSLVPSATLERLSRSIRIKILEEIGRIRMPDLFHFVSLEQLQWYANTLFKDTLSQQSVNSKRRRQIHLEKETKTSGQFPDSSSSSGTVSDPMNDDSPDPTEDDLRDPTEDGRHKSSEFPNIDSQNNSLTPRMGGDEPLLSQFIPQEIIVDANVVQKLGNFLCYTEDIFVGNWNAQFFKDTLESKSIPGEKTCCMPHVNRMKWFELLKKAYGADTSNWNEFHLSAIGDLLVTVPEEELTKIPREAMANAVHPIMKQSGFDHFIAVPGESKKQRFITICAEELGTEGTEMMHAYKSLMRQVTEGAQWLANTVKTTEDLLKDSVGRSGRLPRWAEFTVVRTPRQAPPVKQQLNLTPTEFGNRDQIPQQMTEERQPLQKQDQPLPGRAPYRPVQQIQLPPPRQPEHGRTSTQQPVQRQLVPQIQQTEPGRFGPGRSQGEFGNQFGREFGSQGQGEFGSQFGREQFGSQGQQGQGEFGNQFGREQFGSQGQQGLGEFSNQFGPTIEQEQDLFGAVPQKSGQARFDIQIQQPEQGQYAPQLQQGPDQFGPQILKPGQGRFGIQTQQPEQLGLQNLQPGLGKYAPQIQQGQDQVGPEIQKYGQGRFEIEGQQREKFGPQGQLGQRRPQIQQEEFGNQFQGQFGNQFQGQFGNQNQRQFGNQQGQFNIGQDQSNGQMEFGITRQGQMVDQSRFKGQQGQFKPSPDQSLDLTARRVNGTESSVNPQPSSKTPIVEGLGRSASIDTVSRGVNDQVTCNAIKTAGPAAIGLTMDDLQQMSQTDLFDCVEHIGKLDWEEQTKVGILNTLTQKLGLNFHKLKTYELIEIGNLVTALRINLEDNFNGTSNSPIDVAKMDLKVPESLDVISILGSKITDSQMLKVLADKFNADNSFFPGNPKKIRPENLRIIVQSLGNIVCGFTDKVVNSIFEADAPLFIDCGQTLGKLEGCSAEVLSTLATHAVRPSNYGPPRHWTQEDLEVIGVVFAGLKPEAISTIPPEAMQGLGTRAITALPSTAMSALLPQQISKMSYDAARSISPMQRNSLTPIQEEALNNALQMTIEFDDADDDSARPEGARGLDTQSVTDTDSSINGRTKSKNDDDHKNSEPGDREVTSTSPPPLDGSSSTAAPESEGETAPKSASNVVVGPVVITQAIAYYWLLHYF